MHKAVRTHRQNTKIIKNNCKTHVTLLNRIRLVNCYQNIDYYFTNDAQENMQTRRESFGLKTKYQANDDQTICNKKAPLPGALRYYLEEKERSVDLGFIHRFKSINNALEVESHTSECMPEMPLEEEEC